MEVETMIFCPRCNRYLAFWAGECPFCHFRTPETLSGESYYEDDNEEEDHLYWNEDDEYMEEVVEMKEPSGRQKEIFEWLSKTNFQNSIGEVYIDHTCLLRQRDGRTVEALSWLLNENFEDGLLFNGHRTKFEYCKYSETVEAIVFCKVAIEELPEFSHEIEEKTAPNKSSNEWGKDFDDIPF